MDFRSVKVLVVGAGISGIAAIKVLMSRGAQITVYDEKGWDEVVKNLPPDATERITVLSTWAEIEQHDFNLMVISPGIKPESVQLSPAQIKSIPVISEVELAYLIKSPAVEVIAVTGTNGKTTTTTLLQQILAASGKSAVAGGNIGTALTSVIDGLEEGIVVAEISSFQLESIKTFRPHICGLLNITPDHLDRHKSIDNYIKAKSRIFMNQTAKDYAVFNYEDPVLKKLSEECPAQVVFFSTERELATGAFIKNHSFTVRFDYRESTICRLDEIRLRGKHNQENILCAIVMASLTGAKPETIASVLRTFKGVRHRMEEVAEVEGVLYINDSKGTNPESSIKAIDSFNNPLILIAGGRNKGSSFDLFAQAIKARVRALILLGEAKGDIKRAVMKAGFTNIYEVEDLQDAVTKAHQLAVQDDIVLLSPACASWDMFDNFEQRGDLFCEAVHRLSVSSR